MVCESCLNLARIRRESCAYVTQMLRKIFAFDVRQPAYIELSIWRIEVRHEWQLQCNLDWSKWYIHSSILQIYGTGGWGWQTYICHFDEVKVFEATIVRFYKQLYIARDQFTKVLHFGLQGKVWTWKFIFVKSRSPRNKLLMIMKSSKKESVAPQICSSLPQRSTAGHRRASSGWWERHYSRYDF
jgi:hypothetical protein